MTSLTNNDKPTFRPKRKPVDVRPGNLVEADNFVYRVIEVIDFASVVGVAVESGRSTVLRMADLRPVGSDVQPPDPDLAEIADPDWRIACDRFAAIKPLLGIAMFGREDVSQRAQEIGVDTSTLYRWLERYSAGGAVSSLVPKPRGWRGGRSRLSPIAEQLVDQVLEEFFLTPQRPTAQKTIEEVQRQCLLQGIDAPSPNTIRHRIAKIPEKKRLVRRGEKERARNKFEATPGRFPNADFPLAVVQIDHTPVDLILVDDIYRKPIGRPFLTVAIDVYSRMILGYYLSFDAPSGASVALCVAHAMLPKEEWLILHGVDAQWPAWGVPAKIHVDNGPDFRADSLRASCLQYNIDLEFRPVKVPRYGGHIERLLGTFSSDIHGLPGTTFSSVKEKGEYDAEAHAAMTFSEFEEWLVTLICKSYHRRKHSALGMTPMRKWEIGVLGNSEVDGIGYPPRPTNRPAVLLDFLPAISRTVQRSGVEIDGLFYFDEVLRPWVGAHDPKNANKKREFPFRRDPRDISSLWFRDPDLDEYFRIPFADQSLPSMSIWEYREARARLKAEGDRHFDPKQVLMAVTELREQVQQSAERSKKARRQAQRRKQHEKNVSPANPLPESAPSASAASHDALVDGNLEAFGEIS